MRAIFYSRALLRQTTPEAATSTYVEWVLGAGRFASKHRARARVGVPSTLSAARLGEGGSFRGSDDCVIDLRRTPNVFLMRFTHRDVMEGGFLWHTSVRIQTEEPGARVEHAVAWSGPRGVDRRAMAASPTAFVRLIEENGPDLQPRDMCQAAALRVSADDVVGFVSHILCDEERLVPFVLVTPLNDGGPLVSADLLAMKLAGIARVADLPDKNAAFGLCDELRSRGFGKEFGVSNGAVRLFQPGLSPQQRPFLHPLWLRRNLDLVPENARAEVIAGQAASRIVERTLPLGFFDLIEDHDRSDRLRLTSLLVESAAASSRVAVNEADLGSLREAVANRDARLATLVAALENAQRDAAASSTHIVTLEQQVRDADERASWAELEAQERVGDLEDKLERQADLVRDLSTNFDRIKTERTNVALSPDLRSAMCAVLREQPTLEQCVMLMAALFPDRLIVLPEAFRAARDSAKFKRPMHGLKMLIRLATDYWDALQAGKGGDARARAIFGDNYAARESDLVESNKKARQARTFLYNGEPVLMLKHLKIGVKDSVSETLRIHFEWMAKENLVVIGHVGGHLPFY
jgi:hypothetical protein